MQRSHAQHIIETRIKNENEMHMESTMTVHSNIQADKLSLPRVDG